MSLWLAAILFAAACLTIANRGAGSKVHYGIQLYLVMLELVCAWALVRG